MMRPYPEDRYVQPVDDIEWPEALKSPGQETHTLKKQVYKFVCNPVSKKAKKKRKIQKSSRKTNRKK